MSERQHCPGCFGYHIPAGAMQPFPKCPGLPLPAEVAAVIAAARYARSTADWLPRTGCLVDLWKRVDALDAAQAKES